MGSRRLPLILALLLVVLGCGVGAWLVLSPNGNVAPAVAGGPRPAEPSTPSSAATPLHALMPSLPEAQQGSERASVTVAAEGDEQASFPLAGAHWVEVRVERPLGTPHDEELEVIAAGFRGEGELEMHQVREAEQGLLVFSVESQENEPHVYRARPDASGAFKVAFAADATRGQLGLTGHYLYLASPFEVTLPPSGPITLQPELGGRLRVRFATPATMPGDIERERLAESKLQLQGWAQDSDGHQIRSELDTDLSADLGGLRPELMYSLEAEVPDLVDVHEGPLSFRAGETVERRFELTVGARLRGRVVDDGGAPVAGADLSVDREDGPSFFPGTGPERAETGSDGSFDLRGVAPGKLHLRAREEDHLPAEPRELEVADLQVVEGLELVLPAGNALAGRVTFPDGRPAQSARVELEEVVSEEDGNQFFTYRRPRHASADAEGRFAFEGGLGEGPYELRAQLDTVSDEAAGERVRLHRNETWRTSASDVKPGTEVALVLEPPIAIVGRAVDDTGAAIQRFRVRTGNADEQEAPWQMSVSGQAGNEIESEDGSFELRTLGRGNWSVSVEAEGYGASEPQTVTLPGDTGPFTFVLPRAGRLAGCVLDPHGAPAGGATVRVTRSIGAQPWMDDSNDHTTDAEGRFEIDDVEPGTVELTARHDEFAPSEPLGLEVRPAEPHEQLELALRVGGTLTGEVYRRDGTADPGQQVLAQRAMQGEEGGSAQSDNAGRFTMEHLAPGRYQVVVIPDMGGMDGGEDDPVAMLEQLRMNTAEIVDGEVTHVVLGAPPKAPVLLTGIVREAGRPAPDIVLMALAEGSSMLSNLKSARTAADGTFSLQLPAAGDWLLLAGEDFNGEGSEFALEVPEAESHRVELDLPTGRISGRVVGPDGAPAGGVQVSLAGGGAVSIFNTSGGREVQTEPDGTFRFDRVNAGVYDLRAGSDSAAGFFGERSAKYGVAVLPDVAVEEGGAADGLELRLRAPGTIVGRVRNADGSPASKATVWVRDSAGRVLNPRSWCTTDGAGRFTFLGASEGRHAVLARSELLASEEVSVDVDPGAESEVELTLREGTILVVAVEDEQGKALRARLRVFDEGDRDVSGLGSIQDMERAMSEGFSTREQRFGPLPPGKYRVEGTAQDGSRAAKPVTLSGQPERRLRLRLKE
jgi:hypothetical protein